MRNFKIETLIIAIAVCFTFFGCKSEVQETKDYKTRFLEANANWKPTATFQSSMSGGDNTITVNFPALTVTEGITLWRYSIADANDPSMWSMNTPDTSKSALSVSNDKVVRPLNVWVEVYATIEGKAGAEAILSVLLNDSQIGGN